MGNLLSKFLCWPPSLPKPSRHLLHPVTRIGHSTELDYSVAPEPVMGPGHRLFTQDPSTVPFAAVYYSVPKRRHNLGNDRNSTLGMPSFTPRDSPEKLPGASFPSSETDGRSTKVRIPAPGHRATLCSTREQVVQEVEPVPSNHLHLVHQYDSEARAQEEPTEGRTKEKEGQEVVETQDYKDKTLDEETTVSALTSSSDNHDVPRSYRPAGVLSLEQATINGTVLSDPFSGCSLVPEKSLNDHHQPSSPQAQGSRKEVLGENHPPGPSGSRPPSRAPAHGLQKQKVRTPKKLQLLIPVQLHWDRGEEPPPAKLPRFSLEKDLSTWEVTNPCQQNHNHENEKETSHKNKEVEADGTHPHPAPSCHPPVPSSCRMKSPTPMPMDHTRLHSFLTPSLVPPISTALPITSATALSKTTSSGSVHLMGKPAEDTADGAMDTTPPCAAIILTSASGSTVNTFPLPQASGSTRQIHPSTIPPHTIPIIRRAPYPQPGFSQSLITQTTPHPTFVLPASLQKQQSLLSGSVFVLPKRVLTPGLVGSVSATAFIRPVVHMDEPMDTTPP